MFIGICGSICAGKSTVAQYLVDHHGFKALRIEPARGKDEDASSAVLDGTNGTNGTSHIPSEALATYKQWHATVRVNGSGSSSSSSRLSFLTAEDLLEFVTKRWRERWVTTDVTSEAVLDMFSRRPFFLLVSVDAPLTVRWRRFQAREGTSSSSPAATAPATPTTLETFAIQSDAHLFDPVQGQLPLMSRAAVRLLNTSDSLAHLFATLGKVDLLDGDRLRPSWDAYFMALASLAAQRSNCMKRRVGCVLVREKRVVSTGYNGTPRGLRNCGEGGCARCNGGLGAGLGLSTCLCIHAEENALLEAGRERVRDGTVLYCDTCPCLTCSIKIVQVGIGEVVYSQGYSMDVETAAVFREGGVRLRQFVPPANGLIHLEKLELY